MLKRYMVVLFGKVGYKPTAAKTTEAESPEDALRSTLRVDKSTAVKLVDILEDRVRFYEHDGQEHIVYAYP